MPTPLARAMLWLSLALAGAAGMAIVVFVGGQQGQLWEAALAIVSLLGIMFGVAIGPLALLAALGEARLRRGEGALERWALPPEEWDAFRAFDARRGAEHPGLMNHFAPAAAEGRSVQVLFGRRAVIVDDTYHPLRRFAIPELMRVGWHQPPGAPECLEFSLVYPGGRYGGAKWMALRVPVPRAARDAGVRVYHHFSALLPPPRQGLAFRRPRLVIGGGLAVTLAGSAVAAIAWWLQRAGRQDEVLVGAMIVGIAVAIFGALVTFIIALVVGLSRRARAGT